MSRLVAMAIPITPGKEDEWQQFMKELKDRYLEDFQASRRKAGVRERTFFQPTPMGSFVVVTFEGEHPEDAFQQLTQGKDAFSEWFMQKVKDVHDFDLSQPLPSPMPQLVLDSGSVEELAREKV